MCSRGGRQRGSTGQTCFYLHVDAAFNKQNMARCENLPLQRDRSMVLKTLCVRAVARISPQASFHDQTLFNRACRASGVKMKVGAKTPLQSVCLTP